MSFLLIKSKTDISENDVTSESAYLSRRQLIKSAGIASFGAALGACAAEESASSVSSTPAINASSQGAAKTTHLDYRPASAKGPDGTFTDEPLTPYTDIIRYNNFYEFGTDKGDPAKYSHRLKTSPWNVSVEGEVHRSGEYNLEDFLKRHPLQERIYRLRCVEAWSMVIPWVGFPLVDLIKWLQPTAHARYVEFKTLFDPKQMPGQKSSFSIIEWPYVEGLRLDEAMHPLSFLAVGLYGKTLPNQNGAPLRLVVPWKYGFKSIKSIVSLRFTATEPRTSWNVLAPQEYGFYANVNPEVDHPRWSQASERRLPSSLWKPNRIDTQMFNGYGAQVAHLYQGMNLRQKF